MCWSRACDDGWWGVTRADGSRSARAERRGEGELIVAPTGEFEHDPLRHYVATGEPFLEARTEAADQDELMEELWGALTPEFLAVAVFEPGRLADAAIRHEASAWV